MILKNISIAIVLLLFAFPNPGLGKEETKAVEAKDSEATAGAFQTFLEVKLRARVHRGVNKRSAVIAKIYPGAILRVERRTRTEDCLEGWFERRQGGFVCGQYLKKTDESAEKPAPPDAPDIRVGLETVLVVENGVPAYRKRGHIRKRHPSVELLKGSVLTVKGEVQDRGGAYYETRQGWFVQTEGTRKMSASVTSLGVDATTNGLPGAIVTGRHATVLSSAGEIAEGKGTLDRWSVIPRAKGAPLSTSSDGFVALPDGGYVLDSEVSRVRDAPPPKQLSSSERWIAVDIVEQLVHAYEGTKLVRVIPASTGKRGNTYKGTYRIQKKLKRQDMHLRNNRIRVEDVQWVMFYDKDDGIAIHTAYWHDDFGTPVSHGCVNLPQDDARWLFEWTEPVAMPADSVRVPLPRDSGTRVVVFE